MDPQGTTQIPNWLLMGIGAVVFAVIRWCSDVLKAWAVKRLTRIGELPAVQTAQPGPGTPPGGLGAGAEHTECAHGGAWREEQHNICRKELKAEILELRVRFDRHVEKKGH